jgi:hypothetical protein
MGGGSGLRPTYHRFAGFPVKVVQQRRIGQDPDMAVIWWAVAVLATFGIVLYSVGQVLLRGPADSEVPKSGGILMLVGGALIITGVLLAIAHLAFGLF